MNPITHTDPIHTDPDRSLPDSVTFNNDERFVNFVNFVVF